jgi:chromosome segregation ATPase
MNQNHFPYIAAGLLLALTGGTTVRAADAGSPEARMRETLRNTMLQLRNSETERANLQAAQAENEQKLKALGTQVEALTKQAAEDKKDIDGLNSKLADRDTALANLRVALEKSQSDFKQAADLARTKEAERAKLAGENILLQRRVDDLETKNLTLFKVGNEILTRYEKFGLGTAIAAREPFVGLTRVKLENLVQGYADKLADSRSTPGTAQEQDSRPPADSKPKPKNAAQPAGGAKVKP